MTLLEQFNARCDPTDWYARASIDWHDLVPQIRRAITIAQAVDEIDKENFGSLSVVYRRAEELLAAKEQQT